MTTGNAAQAFINVGEEVKGIKPRQIPERPKAMRLAGLEPFELA